MIGPVDGEESPKCYVPGGLHPVHLDDEYHHGRYRVLRKLGHGRYSTVWLVRDQEKSIYQALKILSAECYSPSSSQQFFELAILQHLSIARPSHPGFHSVLQLRDHFELTGPNGTHVCLVLDPMGESLSSFPTFWDPAIIPPPIAKRFTRQLLWALDYAHDAGVVHTDIKPDNIMVQIRDMSIIDHYLAENPVEPMLLNDPAILPCSIASQDLGSYHLTGDASDLDICLGDWGAASWSHQHLTPLIQPVLLRAPEVVIFAPWGPPVDIWNMGAAVLELVDGVHMFDARNGRTGIYDVKKHVEEMVRLFGPFPRSLLDQARQDIVARCFHEDGSVIDPERKGTAQLENWVQHLDGEEKVAFVAFLRVVMAIDPEKRRTAVELIDEPWLLVWQ
ncbi:uncharacterized protein BP5553_05813 [Venustampulla echinocandica]|uniref:non-specific serine/threonine protein kinase n=1 Tax=Venustampulla echinocandica TaxID=2656787 RepID=A0A370TLQ7_9HELO|nr:uncharacterized protein BP5553_05813 [Venustampulla echinocandica]RDL36461.1 hypothetical protein BP5553_05813 [Venustampulla echinocandica]